MEEEAPKHKYNSSLLKQALTMGDRKLAEKLKFQEMRVKIASDGMEYALSS